MTKADIVEKIQSSTDLTKKDSTDMVEAVFSLIKSTLESGETFKISGFGRFEVKILLRTMILNLVQGGIRWRGTFYSLKELKANRI